MISQYLPLYICILVTTVSLVACSSSPEKSDSASNSLDSSSAINSYSGPVNKVSIDFTDEVINKLKGVAGFDEIKFCRTVIDAFDAKNLFYARSDKSLEIIINRVSIVMSSPTLQIVDLSNVELIAGKIIVTNNLKHIVGEYEIIAGTDGDHGDVSSDWLYEHFADLAAEMQSGRIDNISPVDRGSSRFSRSTPVR